MRPLSRGQKRTRETANTGTLASTSNSQNNASALRRSPRVALAYGAGAGAGVGAGAGAGAGVGAGAGARNGSGIVAANAVAPGVGTGVRKCLRNATRGRKGGKRAAGPPVRASEITRELEESDEREREEAMGNGEEEQGGEVDEQPGTMTQASKSVSSDKRWSTKGTPPAPTRRGAILLITLSTIASSDSKNSNLLYLLQCLDKSGTVDFLDNKSTSIHSAIARCAQLEATAIVNDFHLLVAYVELALRIDWYVLNIFFTSGLY